MHVELYTMVQQIIMLPSSGQMSQMVSGSLNGKMGHNVRLDMLWPGYEPVINSVQEHDCSFRRSRQCIWVLSSVGTFWMLHTLNSLYKQCEAQKIT